MQGWLRWGDELAGQVGITVCLGELSQIVENVVIEHLPHLLGVVLPRASFDEWLHGRSQYQYMGSEESSQLLHSSFPLESQDAIFTNRMDLRFVVVP